MNNKAELLSPAGDNFKARIALEYGADAIYFGGKQYSLRARASNFDFADIKSTIELAHKMNKKVYIVTNILCHNIHMKNAEVFFNEVLKYKPDGFICADPFITELIRKLDKDVEIHISTQQSVTNSKAALFWKRNHASRIVLAREVEYENLKLLTNNVAKNIDIEYFIHGAVCIGYSGRCMLSNNYCLRDANIGGCAQSCRWEYKLYDETKDYANNFSMSAKDMSQIPNLEKILSLPIKSLKIEGRMKTEHYIATVVKAYREAIDEFYANGKIADVNYYNKEVENVANRETNIAWFNGLPDESFMIDSSVQKTVYQNYAFLVNKKLAANKFEVTSKNYFKKDYKFEAIGKNHKKLNFTIKNIYDKDNNSISIVNQPMQTLIIETDQDLNLDTNDICRIKFN